MSNYLCDPCNKRLVSAPFDKTYMDCKDCHDMRVKKFGKPLSEALTNLLQTGFLNVKEDTK